MVAEPLDVQIEQTRILYNNISYNNNDNIIMTISRHIEKAGIVRTVIQAFSSIFTDIQQY